MSQQDHDSDATLRARRADRLLAEALDRPAGERPAFLDQSCAGDPALRALVDRLLAAAEHEGDALRTGAALGHDPLGTVVGEAIAAGATGGRVGAYRLVRPLGSGGFATVFLGERVDGEFEHRVAIKLLRATEEETAGVVRRFTRERQILAALQHPGIAGLLDGGTTDWGQPFLIVEWVDGQPIDAYCEQRGLSQRMRLQLFLDVADAVQHAHQHLVVHRDLKPSNVMVDEEGQVKLLDFGIAKLLGPEREDTEGDETRTVGLWLTPRYASPEQLVGETITTASDVYQLGVLLYELLTSRPAFEQTPNSLAALVATARERASLEPRRVVDVPDDLNAIVMMATRPEVSHRYDSVARLAEDVRSFLAGRPVLARGDALGYRARRFVGRHRLGVALTAVVAVSLLAFAAAITWGFVRAEHERERAESIGAFLKETLRGAQPHVSRGRDTTLLREILDDAAAQIDGKLGDQPYAAADIHLTIAETYRSLSEFAAARVHAASAVAAFEERLGPDARETLYARQLLGLIFWDLGENEEAERVLGDVYQRARRSLGPTDSVTADAISNLGLAVRAQGRLDDAEPLYRQAMKLSLDTRGEASSLTIGTIGNLAFLLAELDRMEEAEPLAVQAAELSRRHLGPEDPDTYLAIDKLAALVAQRGRLAEALELHHEAHAGLLRVLGPRHSTTLGSAYSTSIVLRRLGRYDEAVALLQSILPIVREDFGENSRYMFSTLHELGRSLVAAGRVEEGLPPLEQSCTIAEALLGREHYLYAVISIQYADALIETGEPARAEELLRHARTVLETTFGADGSHRHFDELLRVEDKLVRGAAPS